MPFDPKYSDRSITNFNIMKSFFVLLLICFSYWLICSTLSFTLERINQYVQDDAEYRESKVNAMDKMKNQEIEKHIRAKAIVTFLSVFILCIFLVRWVLKRFPNHSAKNLNIGDQYP